ncbi:uncharacterized protein LOC129772934 [Toxorhynchites rutilus septentrionalis]|uniref:uncharacterized protein LOC129772934 n=1 Tax=Toxorhynchites rutilus septentrionalis TaxID=329112 RepID=UPI00247AFD18|nr:uncharacterized protein LOC129772934 [Toxorhynchites rutilus septentrionalis]
MLLHELVEKLPAIWKMQWSAYKRACPNVNLATFGGFMSDLVNTASDVTLPDLATLSLKSTKQNHTKSKLFVHTQSSPDVEEIPESNPIEEMSKKTCAYCSNPNHEILSCGPFKALDIDARWTAMRQKGLCRICLIPHRKWPCRSGRECGVDGCRLRHHELLHSRTTVMTNSQFRASSAASGNGNVVHNHYHQVLPCTLFRYLPVTIEAGEKRVHTFAFLDDGSSSTLMEAGIAAKLGLEGATESLWLNWTGNVSREEKDSKRVSIVITGEGGKNRFQMNNVRTVKRLNLPKQTLQYDALTEAYPHLKGLPVRSYSEAIPGIIVGLEHARLLSTLKIREGRGDDPVAAKTRLGWCIFGRSSGVGQSLERLHHHSEQDMGNRELHQQMKKFFGIEEAIITVKPEAEVDKRAREIMENTTRRVGLGFETGLVWKHDDVSFPDSFKMAERRLIALEKRLEKDPALRQKVHEQIVSYEEKGYAHRITKNELDSTDSSRVWYLPLGVVQNPKKPGKIRLIWDAAACSKGVCFNDMLLRGPDLLTALFGVLLRFRQRNIAICGDIREMFHQIRIRDLDKQAQRFLWRFSPDMLPQIFVMDVATFGATCSPSSAQFVKNKNAEEHASKYPRAAHAIIYSHYVDDYLDSVETEDDAVQLWNDVKLVRARGGFEIRNFVSNSDEVMQRVGVKDCPANKSLNLDPLGEKERVLGMVWRPDSDDFTFEPSLKPEILKLIVDRTIPTKCQVLRTVMSLFDPLGLIAHFVAQGKILMQDIWRSGTDWDEQITEHLWEKWSRWSQLILELDAVMIPRCFFRGANSGALNSVQLHVFVDASEEAYACVAYLRIVDGGIIRCALVAAKSKVAPLKPLSIPRLELQAAMIGSRLADSICKHISLPISQRFLWLDSATVLAWLRSDSRRYHPFVAFRVGEILSLTTVDEWHHLKSKHNVADEATKWGSGPSFDPEGRWFQGPLFLSKSVESWPVSKGEIPPATEELRAVYTHHHSTFQPLIEVKRFSKWHRLLRSTAYVLRAIKRLKKQQLRPWISCDEYREAENLLWRQVQIECYADEYTSLHYNQQNPLANQMKPYKCSQLYQLTPYIDDVGVMRMNSRIGAAPNAPFQAKYPIILPNNHHLTSLLVNSYHCRFLHANNETVLNEMRQRFRIPSLRNLIRRVSKECPWCRVNKAAPRPPIMAPLPTVRLTSFVRPFTHSGVDYFGPILVKQGRSLVKHWVALFTCLSIRAIHLEIVHSLTTQSCVMAIRRFIARRGAPETFYSDNGTNFIGANNLLKGQLRAVNEHCAATFTNARTKWQFNPPSAPHMGGAWERLVRSVKTAMATISDHPHHPSDEVLETVALEAEAVVNSRPLTYVALDSSDAEAITPNHFLLYGTRGIDQLPTPLTEGVATLRDSWKLAQGLIDKFWRRWIREYLSELARRTKWYQPVKALEIGDLVIVIDENKRNGWMRGRIINVTEGKDGQVRKAEVKTANGIITRPAVKLALLDIVK